MECLAVLARILIHASEFAVEPRLDLGEVRAQKQEEKRRNTERVLFRNLLSVYSVVGDTSMCPIELIEVSEDGCSFQVPFRPEKPWPASAIELPLRLYFSQDTFLEVKMTIVNSRPSIDHGDRYIRYGCSVDKQGPAYAAYQQFVRFLKLYADQSRQDTGGVKVFYF